MDAELCVTLSEQVTIPGGGHHPKQTTVFRAGDHTERDGHTVFYDVNLGPEDTVLRVANDNIRAIAFVEGE